MGLENDIFFIEKLMSLPTIFILRKTDNGQLL